MRITQVINSVAEVKQSFLSQGIACELMRGFFLKVLQVLYCGFSRNLFPAVLNFH